jgi:hypothetical protein
MIQIQNPKQFTRAAERLQAERMNVRKSEAHAYEVTNKTKGTQYTVRFIQRDGSTFVSCSCPAGLRHNRAPLTCKHVAAAIIFVRAIRAMRERAAH